MKIAIWGELSDDKFIAKVTALIVLKKISKVHLVRYSGNPFSGEINAKIEYLYPKFKSKRLYEISGLIFLLSKRIFSGLDLIVSVYFVPNGVYTTLIGRIFGIPIIQVLPGSDLNIIKKSKVLQNLLHRSEGVAVRGRHSFSEVISLGVERSKIFILDNLLEFPNIKSANTTHSIKEFDLIFVGYFRPMKRLDLLLLIIKDLKDKYSGHLKVALLGDGPIRTHIELLIDKYELSENVYLPGHIENVGDYYLRSRVFVLTSESEGLNMAMIEAMAYGLPVVVSNVNDLSDVVIDGENGFLIKYGEILDYVERIIHLLKDDESYNRISNNAKTTIQNLCENNYSLETLSKVWENQVIRLTGKDEKSSD